MADTFEEARPDLVDLQVHNYRGGTGLASSYRRDRGLLCIPVMGPVGTPPVVARVHAPIGFRDVRYQYIKEGSPPLMPAAADTESGDKILTEQHEFPAPTTTLSGALLFGVRGHYTYVQPDGGRGPDDEFPIDAHPFPTLVDTLGEFDARVTGPFVSQVLDGRWNREVVDSRVLSAYRIIG